MRDVSESFTPNLDIVPTLFVKFSSFSMSSNDKLIFLSSVTVTLYSSMSDVFSTVILYATMSPTFTSGIVPLSISSPLTLSTVFVTFIEGNVLIISSLSWLYVVTYPSGILTSRTW